MQARLTHGSALRSRLVVAMAATGLTGCWTAPRLDVRASGEPRPIQNDIIVASELDQQTVQSFDAGTRRLTIADTVGGTQTSYAIARSMAGVESLRVGELVCLRIDATLSVSVEAPAPAMPESGVINARILTVDPSYRVLTAAFRNGRTQSFKMGLDVRLQAMQPGDAISMRPIAITGIRPRHC